MHDVPASIDHVTAEWLTTALNGGGVPGTVRAVEARAIGTGQIGSTYRLSITYEPGSADAPPVLIAKMAAGDEAARQRVADGYRKEVGFYTDLAPTVEVRTPRCWYSAISPDNTDFVLLLDDLDPAMPGVQADGCTLAQATESIANLAGLHAPRWNDVALQDLPYLAAGGADAGAFLQEILITATEEFVGRYDTVLTGDDIETLRLTARAIGSWYTARPEPFAITHGDYRLDNLMFSPDGRVTALDWQTVGVGPPARDLAYFIGTCLEPDLRREHEDGLVAGYHAAIVGRGVSDYALDRCVVDYRLGQLQGPFITVLGCIYATATPSARSDGMFLAMATRSCAAIRDLRSLDLL